MQQEWNDHYYRNKSELSFPDENLVRLLMHYSRDVDCNTITILDIGCGSGRHIPLLKSFDFKCVIGLDISHRALEITKKFNPHYLIQNKNTAQPFKDHTADAIVAWGSLHYNPKTDITTMIDEIHRILKTGGSFFGTLRSSRDTYLKKGIHRGNDVWQTDLEDIKGSIASFYSEEEIRSIFSPFSSFSLGLIERTILGDLNSRLSHWVFKAVK